MIKADERYFAELFAGAPDCAEFRVRTGIVLGQHDIPCAAQKLSSFGADDGRTKGDGPRSAETAPGKAHQLSHDRLITIMLCIENLRH